MTQPQWIVRHTRKTKADRALLKSFMCADSAFDWQVEVESFVQDGLLDWVFDPLAQAQDPRLLLVLERKTKELIGVVSHERTTLAGEEVLAPR